MTTAIVPTTTTAPPPATAVDKSALPPTDIELHLLQAFGEFASTRVVSSYLYVKSCSRLLGFLATTTEKIVTKTGLVSLVGFLFAQYQRLGHPWVQYVDDAMGRRIIDAFVNILLLAQQQQQDAIATNNNDDVALLENGHDATATHDALKLSYQERIQALLRGEVPRLQALVQDLERREGEALERSAYPPPVIMDLQDFVPKDEVKRIKDETKSELATMQAEIAQLKSDLLELERAKQQVEQDLTDVHNYKESERGQRFQDMEEELARAKLEASQKAHDIRKLELVVEALKRKRKSSKSKGSTAARSISSEHSDGAGSPTDDTMASTA